MWSRTWRGKAKRENGFRHVLAKRAEGPEDRKGGLRYRSTTVPFTAPDEAMPDVEGSAAKKSIERKKHPRVANVLKESVGATTITMRILDLGVNLTVGELRALALAVEKNSQKPFLRKRQFSFESIPWALVKLLRLKSLILGILWGPQRAKSGLKMAQRLWHFWIPPLDVTVSAARSSQSKRNDAPAKEPIKRILRKLIQKEDSYATPKNVRFGSGGQ